MITPNRKRPYSDPVASILSLSAITATIMITRIVKLVGGVRLLSPYHFDPSRTYLVLCNHQSQLDAFTIYGSLGPRQNIICAPTMFLTAKQIYYGPMFLWLKSMGCYPTKNRRLTVPQTVSYLGNGYSVCLFPEGRRTTRSESNPKDGTRLILDELKERHLDITVVFAHIEWEPFRLFRRASVRFATAPKDVYSMSVSKIMNAIYEV